HLSIVNGYKYLLKNISIFILNMEESEILPITFEYILKDDNIELFLKIIKIKKIYLKDVSLLNKAFLLKCENITEYLIKKGSYKEKDIFEIFNNLPLEHELDVLLFNRIGKDKKQEIFSNFIRTKN